MSTPDRVIEKVKLLRKIERQRAELSAGRLEWLEATAKVDRGWVKFIDMRKYLVLGSSVLAIYGIRHPSKVVRWSRRAFGIWGTVQLFRRNFIKP
ncbi:MAG: YqjK-like family protein [Ewingella sp.]|uniref:YqjK-like family protein n=1 Tax=Ewingella TaxID=41201 RepID=UPI0026505080|nr:YqjK-like family protein [Ewingella sp.]